MAGRRTPEIVVGDKQTLTRVLTKEFVLRGAAAIEARGRFVVALSGGSLATEFYPALARLEFDWTRTEFFWVDERAVPPMHPDSNFRAARSSWFDPARVPPTNVHPMAADRQDLEQAAKDYAEELIAAAGDPPRMDLALIGMGPDGHVASIFPNHALSDIGSDLVAVVRQAPKPPPVRLTLTMDALRAVHRPLLIALGGEKAEAVREALSADGKSPAARLARDNGALAVLVDEEAASLLPNKVE
jgi:6-phosphogluconolactonase